MRKPFLFVCALAIINLAQGQILLQNVQNLVLTQGMMTAARRSYSVPQINVIGGSARSHYRALTTMNCKNIGFDGVDVTWKCEAPLESNLKLGRVVINCEGYTSPMDPYILPGSCGAEVNLEYAYGSQQNTFHSSYQYNDPYQDTDSVFGAIIVFILIILFIYFICNCCYYYDYYLLPYAPYGLYQPRPVIYTGNPFLFVRPPSYYGSYGGWSGSGWSSSSGGTSTSTSFGTTSRR